MRLTFIIFATLAFVTADAYASSPCGEAAAETNTVIKRAKADMENEESEPLPMPRLRLKWTTPALMRN